MAYSIRPATIADVPHIVQHRELMFREMRIPAEFEDMSIATDLWLRLWWVRPLAGQFDTLPVAAYMDTASPTTPDQVIVAYFRGGQVVGYQPIVPLQTTLLAPPALYADRDRHLYLAWSEPTANGYAELKLTTTRG